MRRGLSVLPSVVRCDELREHPVAKFGLPCTASVVSTDDFIAQFDYRTRCPSFVLERLTRASAFADHGADRKDHSFFQDSRIPSRMQSCSADFASTGYDRGHMAAAANHRASKTAMEATFTLANVAPQKAALNRRYWARIEMFCRGLVKSRFEEAYVITGALYLPSLCDSRGQWFADYKTLGRAPRHVHVPTHFYKVILIEERADRFLILALVVPNEEVDADIPLTHFLVPLQTLEEAAGVTFFPKLLDDDMAPPLCVSFFSFVQFSGRSGRQPLR
eukprot:TRINITY_DN65272_c0_g1_i1.p1 TRINITY_DN65272_c0_g1~~TRINITY_DN65272_c0_g1_i1.p1  ORF type:complete len:276 (-),score=1.86 TRINITY_DN65272_c0_g1_i1:2-829(-)